jgi:plastocyanin
MLVALLLVGAPVASGAEPEFSTSFANPAYTFAAACVLTQPLVFINVVVANRGTAPLAEIPFTATDGTGTLHGNATTQLLAAGAQLTLRIPMLHVPSSATPIGGTHSITVMAGLRRVGSLELPIPMTFCPAPTQVFSRVHPGVVAPSASPIYTQVAKANSNASKIILALHTPAVPGNVRNANGAQDCAAHVGLLGALVCPDLIRSGRMLLIWDWEAGVGPAAIDGYRVYRVDGGKRLVYTRADKKDITLFDVAVPPGGYVGTCYAVSAYVSAVESELSPAFCPTRLQTMVAAAPTIASPAPKPRAPTHVDIHVTEDVYPTDTVLAAGGSVTWINDDTDPHTVYGFGGSFSGELNPNGGRYTMTFRDLGYPYVVSYTCQYHAGMHGKILVVLNP